MLPTTPKNTFETWLIVLRISIGVIYVWFGVLKFFPGVSPAEELAKQTIHLITFGLIQPNVSIVLLAIWETVVGALLISGFYLHVVIRVVIVHMMCTFTPLVVLPNESFTSAPLALSLVGQYIIKNIVIVSALFVIDNAPDFSANKR